MHSSTKAAGSIALVVALGASGTSPQAPAWGRNVTVNGASMSNEQLAYLDRLHCERIPDGNYFLTQLGNGRWVWGYAALPGVPQGFLGENCPAHQVQQGSSGGSSSVGSPGWSNEYSQIYGGGTPAGDGTFEIYDGASGDFIYQ